MDRKTGIYNQIIDFDEGEGIITEVDADAAAERIATSVGSYLADRPAIDIVEEIADILYEETLFDYFPCEELAQRIFETWLA